ncbi:MAG: RNA-binding protein [Candidatus Bathyarchaeia archaeon]
MSKKYRRYFLKAKEAKSLLKEASEKLKISLEKNLSSDTRIELVETDFGEIFLVNGKPLFFKTEGNIFPTLVFTELLASTPKVVVDMGAVPHVCNGADVMAPGVVRFEGNFDKGDLIFVVDEKHGKPIAVGKTEYSDAEVKEIRRGVVVKNIHFVGDKIWNSLKEFTNIMK